MTPINIYRSKWAA